MIDKLFGSDRRGGVLLIAGLLLAAFVAGPGTSIAQKVMGLTATTADKRYVKRGETLAAGKTEETKIEKFNSTTFTPLAQAKLNAPGAGFLYITGDLSASDDVTTPGGSRLQYRLAVNDTPLTTTAETFELTLEEDTLPAAPNPRANGSVSGVIKTTAKGEYKVVLQAQEAAGAPAGSSTIYGRGVNVIFVPKGKLPKPVKAPKTTKKPKTGTGEESPMTP
jgi:hypothetical protein